MFDTDLSLAPDFDGPPEPFVTFDVDDATYVGDEQDGCHYQTGEGPDGWYVTVVVDSDTGGFVMDMVADDGPYDSEEHAAWVGRDLSTTWCIDNSVCYGHDETDTEACSACGRGDAYDA